MFTNNLPSSFKMVGLNSPVPFVISEGIISGLIFPPLSRQCFTKFSIKKNKPIESIYCIYAWDSDQEILDATWNAEVESISAVLITLAQMVIISGPFGKTPSPPRIELPRSVN